MEMRAARRFRSRQERRQIVEETLKPGSFGFTSRAGARHKCESGLSLAQAISGRVVR
jgi:hypothetical protein